MLINSIIHISECMNFNIPASISFDGYLCVSVCVCVFFRALSHGEHTSGFASPVSLSCRKTQAQGKFCLLYHRRSVKGQQRGLVCWLSPTGSMHHWLTHKRSAKLTHILRAIVLVSKTETHCKLKSASVIHCFHHQNSSQDKYKMIT